MRREVSLVVLQLFFLLTIVSGTITVVFEISGGTEDPNAVATRLLSNFQNGGTLLGQTTITNLTKGNALVAPPATPTPSPITTGTTTSSPTPSPITTGTTTSSPTPSPTTTGITTGTPTPPSSNGVPSNYSVALTIIPGQLVLYHKPITGETIEYAMVGQTSGWVGIGFTAGQYAMVGSDAVIGWVINGVATVGAYALNGKSVNMVVPSNFPIGTTSGQEADGQTTIFFTRTYNTGMNPITATKPATYIGAWGDEDALSYHTNWAETATSDTGATVTSRPFSLYDVHGILMMIGWGVIIPFGVLFARYAKPLPDAIWFKVHRISQILGYVIAIAGFIIAFIMVKGQHWRQMAHSVIGIVVMALGLIQVVGALLRPHKEPGQKPTTQRLAFEIFHHWNGRSLTLLAIANVIFGWVIIQKWSIGVIIAYAIVLFLALVFIVYSEVKLRMCHTDHMRVDTL